ncbi:MAG: hypothetical protein WCG50_09350 [Rhodoferax sp.]
MNAVFELVFMLFNAVVGLVLFAFTVIMWPVTILFRFCCRVVYAFQTWGK